MTFISEKERIFGGLFGAAAGDAVGLTFEGMSPASRCNLSVSGGGQFGLEAGAVTDDTMMTLALLRTYLSCKTFDRDAFLLRMTEIVRRDPVTFGRTTKTLCTLLEQGCLPEAAVQTVDSLFGSRTNGSVMRTLPVGLVCDPRTAAAEARRVSAFTHFNPAAGDCCAAVSTAAAVLLAGGERDDALAAARIAAGRTDLFSGALIPSVDAVKATRCALFCFRKSASVRDCIERAAALGGDTDTIAAIAGGLAGLYFGMENIPKEWVCQINIRKSIAACAGTLMSARAAVRQV
ncbi:MAG: ADP-ribosylglycohydrolase family protein [Methanocalculaceae archaeon]|nr:ADP-ribosylglycohydrolase family protein [Methanocalculaceae archaeon]